MAGTIRLINGSAKAAGGAVTKMKIADTPLSDFIAVDNSDGFTFQGLDANGQPVDLTDVLTVVATITDPTVMGVVNVNGTRVKVAPLKAAAGGNLNCTLTYKQGGAGPFSVQVPITVYGNPAIELRYGITGGLGIV